MEEWESGNGRLPMELDVYEVMDHITYLTLCVIASLLGSR